MPFRGSGNPRKAACHLLVRDVSFLRDNALPARWNGVITFPSKSIDLVSDWLTIASSHERLQL